jgi:hypothetical protein
MPTSHYLSASKLSNEERIVLASSKVSVGRRVLVVRFRDMTVFRGRKLSHRFGPDEERPVWHDEEQTSPDGSASLTTVAEEHKMPLETVNDLFTLLRAAIGNA